MVLSDKIAITVNSANINHYNKYYDNIKVKDVIYVNICELTKGTKYKIKMKCDKCSSEHELPYNIIYNNNYINYYLCKKCKVKDTIQKKYGVDNVFQSESIKNKSKETIQQKYGVDNISQNQEIKNKKMNTFFKNFGVNWGLSSDIIKEKSKNTLLTKFNVNNISQIKEIKEKKEKTCFKNYGVNYISQHENFKKELNNKILKKLKLKYNNLISINGDYFTFFCEDCYKNFEINKKAFYSRYNLNVNLCTLCNPIGDIHSSGLEKNIYNFISKNLNIEIYKNNKNVIKPYELDIYIPELKLAFEFNGLFWHNENNIESNYHLNKTELCEKQGIKLIHIWEDDWMYKQEIVKSIILNKLGKKINKIFARKTEIKEIYDNKLVKEFLEQNHLQGFVGSKVKLGLFYENELVSLMTFGKRRVSMGKKSSNEDEYELLRFCNKLNTNVIGGASKLFKYFIDNYQPKEITTYADRSISQGKLYETLGFKFISKTQPNYYYIIDKVRKHRFNFRKDILIKEGYDSNKTEHEIMLERKIFRIYDSGNLKFEFKK